MAAFGNRFHRHYGQAILKLGAIGCLIDRGGQNIVEIHFILAHTLHSIPCHVDLMAVTDIMQVFNGAHDADIHMPVFLTTVIHCLHVHIMFTHCNGKSIAQLIGRGQLFVIHIDLVFHQPSRVFWSFPCEG